MHWLPQPALPCAKNKLFLAAVNHHMQRLEADNCSLVFCGAGAPVGWQQKWVCVYFYIDQVSLRRALVSHYQHTSPVEAHEHASQRKTSTLQTWGCVLLTSG